MAKRTFIDFLLPLSFPLQFSRTIAPDTSKGNALIAFMRYSHFAKAVILTSIELVWFESGLGLTKKLKAAGIEIVKPAAFETNQFKTATLWEIKRSGVCSESKVQ